MNLILISFSLISISTCCSIFPSLNCSCFQTNISSSLKTYSHLYCQGNSLTEKTFQSPFGSDFKYQNHFRTISIEFNNAKHLEIHSNQFDPIAMLFSQTNFDTQIDIYLRFIGFDQIIFHKQSLTSTIFQRKHQNKRLWIYLIPARNNFTQFEFDNENLTNTKEQFYFSLNCFSGLILSQLNIHIYTIQDYFPLKYSFEQIFNHTNIGELHFYGAIIRPSLEQITFHGLIRSLILHRHVDTIDSNTFPYYSQVYSYTIHSIEAHSMNLSSFIYSHRNLRGLEIIKPRFEVSIDQLIPTLDSLTLDIQHLNKKTFLIARHIHNLKLGSQVRTINPEIFDLLSHRLHHLDLSDINLSQMTSDSLCHLLKYLSKHSNNNQLNIIYPQMKSLIECDCARIFLNYIQLKYDHNDSMCSTLCHFSDCQIISEYFKENYPLINQTNETLIEIESFSDSIDIDMIHFLINQTSNQEKNETQRRPIIIDLGNISILENIQEYDEGFSFSTPSLFQPLTTNQIDKYEFFSWLSFSIGVSVVLLLLLIISLIIFLIIRYRKRHNFKPLPVYV